MNYKYLLFPVFSLALASQCLADSWPHFRGPDGSATAPEATSFPLVWGAEKNLKWKTPLPGPGSSSPVVWEDKIFVTCYTGYGMDKHEIGQPEDLGRMALP